jgi:hypothetical protein
LGVGIKEAEISEEQGNLVKNSSELDKIEKDLEAGIISLEDEATYGDIQFTKGGNIVGQQTGTIQDKINYLESQLEKDRKDIIGKIESKVEKEKRLDLFQQTDLDDGIDLRDIIMTVGEAVPSLTAMGVGTATRNPYLTGLGFATIFSSEYGNNYYQALVQGLQNDGIETTPENIAKAIEEDKYANKATAAATAAISTGLERLGALKIVKNTMKALRLGDDLTSGLGSLYKGEIKKFGIGLVGAGKRQAKTGLGEYLTEGAQTGISQVSTGLQLGGIQDTFKYLEAKPIATSAKAGGIVGTVLPFGSSVYTQSTVELRNAARDVATKFDMGKFGKNFKEANQFFKGAEQNLKNKFETGELTEEQYQQEVDNLSSFRNTGLKIPKEFSTNSKQKIFDLMVERDNLSRQIEDLDPQTTIEEQDRIKAINTEIAEISAKEKVSKGLRGVTASIAKLEGRPLEAFENTEDFNKAIDQDPDIPQEQKQEAKEAEGVFVGKGKIYIDKQKAAKVGNIGVGAHEFLHPILNALVGDVNQQEKIVNDFEKLLSKSQQAKMNRLLEVYKDKDTGVLDPKKRASEYLTVFSNAIIDGEIKYNENIFKRIGEYLLRLFGREGGFKNANFESAEGVYSFLKEYNRTIQKETGLSERALELIKKREAETGVKVAEVDILNIPQFSKTDLKSEIDIFVQEDGAKKYDTKAEFQMSDDFANAYTKITDSNLLDGSVLSIINRDDNLSGLSDDVKAEIIEKTKENVSMRFLQNFDPAKNESLFGWMLGKNGALGFAVLDVKKDYAKTARETSLDVPAGERGFVGDIAVEPTTEQAIDEAIKVTRAEAKLIDPVDIITDKATRDKYRETVQSKIENLTDKQLSFKNLKDLAPEITAEVFGVPVKKVIDPTANLSKGDATNAQMFITKNADKLIKLLPEGAVLEAATEKLIGTSTGVPKKLLDAFYDKQERITKKAGLFPYKKKPNITKEDFLAAFGIVEGKKAPDFSPRSSEAQATKGLMSLFGRLMTNTTVRKELAKTPGTEAVVQDIAAGKAPLQFSRKAKTALDLPSNSINFKDKQQLTDGRNALVKLAKALGPEKTMKYLLPTVQSQWGLLGGKFVVDDSEGFTKVTRQDGKFRTNQFLTLGRKDFFDLIDGTAFDSAKYEKGKTFATINGKKIETTKVPKQTPEGFVSGKFFDNINKRIKFAENQRQGFKEIVEEIKKLYEDGQLTKNQVGMILATFNSNINGLIRTAAIPGLYFRLEGLDSDSDYRYEHTQTASDTLVDIAKYITDPNYSYSFDNIMEGFRVAIIPKIYDNIINKVKNKNSNRTYRSDGPRDSNGDLIKGSGTNVIRYNSKDSKKAIADAGLPPLELKEVKTKKEGKNLQFSKKAKILDTQFNNILENKTGIAAGKEYSKAKAEVVGANKGRFNWFIPPTAEDFVGLLYQFLGKGKLGDRQMAWFKVNLLDPYARAMSKVSRDRVSTARNYRALKKELDIVPKDLKKKVPGEDFTVEQAVRVYIWNKQGYEVPGLSQQDSKELREYVNSKPELKEFGDKLILLNKGFDYAKPKAGWLAGTITTDMLETLNTTKRAEYLKEWQNNVDVIFSEKNLNKIEAAYGPKFRYALENVLTRMKTGRNRTYGTDSLTGRVVDWLTNSIGAIMFFNTRSAILQTISAINFINFSDNNPLAATKALSNQKQYWSDFLKLFNSDFLVDRRDGLRLNVNESDIADMAKKNGARGVISEILKAGFLPTQLADSFAIASGGATFYRNRLNRYLKEGVDPKKAEEMAFTDFREIAEESQQSSRPDRISAQQAGPLGRVILAFANTPAQYARLMKKAVSDLKNNRGDAKTNISKLIYYGVAQNLLFNAMQQALFGLMFGDEEEEDEKKEKKVINIANSMADSILRGMGISGAIVSVLKNTVKKLIERADKRQPDYAENAIAELLKISPPVGSKVSKVKNALRSYEWEKDEMYEKGLALDNPAYLAAGNIISAATNIPLDRAVKKVTNVKNAMDEDLQLWQRIALLGGWQDWEIGAKEEERERQNRNKAKFKTTTFKTTKFK